MKKRLYKSDKDKKVCGVCGGIANYFDVDPTVIRLAWIIFTLAGGSGLIAYIIAALSCRKIRDTLICRLVFSKLYSLCSKQLYLYLICNMESNTTGDMQMISIRTATEDDAEELLAIYAPYVKQTAITFEYDVPSKKDFKSRYQSYIGKISLSGGRRGWKDSRLCLCQSV